MTFYVPYNTIKFFTGKEGDQYRHVLSFRLYLYIIHFHSGRIRWNERKKLVHVFKSSHTAVKNALNYLGSIGLVNFKKGWVECISQKSDVFGNEPLNIQFEFDVNLLLNRNAFVNHLFLCCFQAIAMVKGRKIKKSTSWFEPEYDENETPQSKKMVLRTSTKDAFIQRQSYSYQAVMMDRHEQTMVRRNRLINAENHYLLNQNPKRLRNYKPERTALTQDGFNTKTLSPIVGFHERKPAETHLGELKVNNPIKYEKCYVGEANHGGYVIIKHLPLKYEFMVNYKKN